MKKLNLLFSLSSLSVILVTAERFSFTTKVILQPYSFLRLHELVQMIVLILLTVIIPFFILKEVTHNFDSIKVRRGLILFFFFIVGIYFYSTGNGIHETSSFYFNNFCNTRHFSGDLCGGFFFNDYYTGNIFYFVGGAIMVVSLLLLERLKPANGFRQEDFLIMIPNAFIYAFAIFAYAAFDRVLVGLIFSLIVMLLADTLWFFSRKKYLHYPLTTYTTLTYTLGAIASLIVRFH